MAGSSFVRRAAAAFGLAVLVVGLAGPAGADGAETAAANDAFGHAFVLPHSGGRFDGVNNIDATKQPAEPNHAHNVGGASVWFKWTPNQSGRAFINTLGSDFDTLLAVYRGRHLASLTRVAQNDDISPGHLRSRVRFMAQAGTTYRIAIDGFRYPDGPSMGNIVFRVGRLSS